MPDIEDMERRIQELEKKVVEISNHPKIRKLTPEEIAKNLKRKEESWKRVREKLHSICNPK